ncbi:MAG: hypothetical protein MK313_15845 [Oceanibaculum sp.]|nr:hypothetical protein [Oceanibaculum sp.]MCH2396144.1 hypothetical protein [Oceanibaculum sp.]
MTDRLNHSQRVAAARAGFSERTARRIERDPRPPSQRKPARSRTVPDPLVAVWEPVLLPILERDPVVQAVTLMRHLQLTDPESFPDDRVRRTLERRVCGWRALHGPERDVIFRQTPEPGRMALSDFTDAGELGVTIGGQPLAHRPLPFCPGLQRLGTCRRGPGRGELHRAGGEPPERGYRISPNTVWSLLRKAVSGVLAPPPGGLAGMRCYLD